MNRNGHERRSDDRNLRLSLPIDNNWPNRRVLNELPARGGPLPPVVPVDWDKINVGKHGGNVNAPRSHQGHNNREYIHGEYDDYNNFKASIGVLLAVFLLIVLPVLHLILFGITKLRDYLHRKYIILN